MSGSDCNDAIDRLFEYMDGELTDDDIRRIGAHLKDCPPCEAEHRISEKIKSLTALSGGDVAPDDLRARVLASIRSASGEC